MYYLLSLLSGALIAVMVSINGELTVWGGAYLSCVIIHLVGSLFATGYLLLRGKLKGIWRQGPFWFYLGGILGVVTTFSNNLAFGHLSITAMLGIGLLGQSVAGLVIDQFGLFQMPRRPFSAFRCWGLLLLVLGGLVMILPLSSTPLFAVMLSFLAGASIVLTRAVNGGLSVKIGAMQSSLVNHLVGLLASLLLLFLLGRGDLPALLGPWASPVIYIGGIFGVLVVMLTNFTSQRTLSLYWSMSVFVGQIFTGLFMDYLFTGQFSEKNLLGGGLVLLGLITNLLLERKKSQPPQPTPK